MALFVGADPGRIPDLASHGAGVSARMVANGVIRFATIRADTGSTKIGVVETPIAGRSRSAPAISRNVHHPLRNAARRGSGVTERALPTLWFVRKRPHGGLDPVQYEAKFRR